MKNGKLRKRLYHITRVIANTQKLIEERRNNYIIASSPEDAEKAKRQLELAIYQLEKVTEYKEQLEKQLKQLGD
jgi:hypothetical protein